MIQVIGTFVTNGDVLSLGLGAGFEKLPVEQQRDILRYCGEFLEATAKDMDAEIEALKQGTGADGAEIKGEAA